MVVVHVAANLSLPKMKLFGYSIERIGGLVADGFWRCFGFSFGDRLLAHHASFPCLEGDDNARQSAKNGLEYQAS